MKVYDLFLFSNELDLLELRLQEHSSFVDFFVLVQANRTFTGKPKSTSFDKSDPRFSLYSDKIIELTVDLKEVPSSAWENEAIQRNALFRAAKFDSTDIIYLSDVDEIISREHWSYLLNRMENENLIKVWQRLFYYKLNLEITDCFWALAKLMRAGVFLDSGRTASELRAFDDAICTPFPCGWHFSYLMSPTNISEKIESFSHQEFNVPNLNNEAAIRTAIEQRKDLFNRELTFRVVPVDHSWPTAVTTDPKWKDFIISLSLKEKLLFWISEKSKIYFGSKS